MQPDSWIRALYSPKRFLINPGYARLLAEQNLTTPEMFLRLQGAIISGHPDRHVMRSAIGSMSVYVKREHVIPLRDRLISFRDGFGLVSVSVREAATLQSLSERGIHAPEWIAAGETEGRAFLVVKDAGTSTNLKRVLSRADSPRGERLMLARLLGRHVAQIHNSGIDYPDLYAKHILVDPRTASVTFLDWQRSRTPRRLSWRTRCRDLAALHASLPDELADLRLRLVFLRSYLRHSNDGSRPARELCRRVGNRRVTLLQRSSIREQRLPTVRDSQPLFWLDGEALCVTEMGRDLLDPAQISRMAYPRPDNAPASFSERRITITGPLDATLTVRRARRIWRRSQQTQELRVAADLLRRERLGEPARLLAFGQYKRSRTVVDSFLLVLNERRATEALC